MKENEYRNLKLNFNNRLKDIYYRIDINDYFKFFYLYIENFFLNFLIDITP
jgi:hypothetical protein